LKSFVTFVQTQFETTIKIIRRYTEIEFFMTNFFANKRIEYQIFCVNILQKNNIVERKHGHILNVVGVKNLKGSST